MVGYFSVQSMCKGPPKNLTWRERDERIIDGSISFRLKQVEGTISKYT